MVTEFAIFHLLPGRGPEFETAFAGVAALLAGADGYRGHRLIPTLDEADGYVLQVDWRDLAAHTEAFEPSDAHARFIAALTPHLASEPVVAHIRPTRAETR